MHTAPKADKTIPLVIFRLLIISLDLLSEDCNAKSQRLPAVIPFQSSVRKGDAGKFVPL
jgi:hypothetical protein